MTKKRKAASSWYKWEFKARFRRRAFGWRSRPAIERVRQAVREIRKVARRDAVLAAEGAVSFLERVPPALERVDSSSGAIGTAVNNAIAELVPIIARAPADAGTREGWLERLFEAHASQEIPWLVEDIVRLRKDDALFNDILGIRGTASRSRRSLQTSRTRRTPVSRRPSRE